jgi:MFS family permease
MSAARCSRSAEGFQEVRTRGWLWVTVVVFALAIPLGYAPLFVLGPTLAEDGYGTAAIFGILTTAFGAGALAGALLGLRWRPEHPMRAAFLVIAAWPFMLIAFALEAPVALVLVLVLGAATGAGFAMFDILWNTAMAERIPPHALSRASSYEWMGSLILLPVGFLAAGPAAEATSPETVLVVGGILTAVVLALGLIPRETRTMRRLERDAFRV